jgi:hypothetical protein
VIVSTFEDFVSAVVHYYNVNAPADWRVGQCAFNLLVKVRPDIAELLRGSDFDPFNDDSRLSDFYDFVMRYW